jgi:hypothetical protein
MTIKITDLNLDHLNFEKVKFGNNTTFIKPTYIKSDCPLLEFPWLPLSVFGVPPISQYTKEDKQRMFIKVPIETGDLYNQLVRIDEKMKTHQITLNLDIFNASHQYEYEPLVKYDEKHNKAYIKVKLDTSYPENKILTEVWHLGGGTKWQRHFNNIDEFALCIPFKSDISMRIKVTSLWIMNNKYGLTIKLKNIEVKPFQPNHIGFAEFKELMNDKVFA